ncbi:MAG: PD-(D/E)XK nuclease family protein, partial [Cyanobacteria bacterium REEB65]|nr:PD-(D/E)XK nuclease family protein [Cyanobacteria bacterium REEB65]
GAKRRSGFARSMGGMRGAGTPPRSHCPEGEFPLRLSAYALTRRDRCERRFVLDYSCHLLWPAAASEGDREHLRLGQDFHRLVQRHRLGIPVHPRGDLAVLWQAFMASPYAQGGGLAEQVLQFSLPGATDSPVWFLVRFDEVRQEGDGSWTILDWKTGRRTPHADDRGGDRDLEQSWQTRLYRFALTTAGATLNGGAPIPPERIKLVYYFVRTGETLSLPYDATRYEADRQVLLEIARTAKVSLAEARWPARPESCRSCPFDSFCNVSLPPPPAPPPLELPRFIL